MILWIIAFTSRGCQLANEICKGLSDQGMNCEAYAKTSARSHNLVTVKTSLETWTARAFNESDAIVFIGASGIAVRSIAPHIKSKTQDPAIIVVDDLGQHVISLLSGHIGGGNDLTLKIAKLIGAEPVITTATDIHGVFSVDTFASKNNMIIDDMSLAKDISSRLLEGDIIGLASDHPLIGKVPRELSINEECDLGIHISSKNNKSPFIRSLRLIPRNIVIGIGCIKGVSEEKIAEKVFDVFDINELSFKGAHAVASVDLKANESGLLKFCEKYNLALKFFNEVELRALPDIGFSHSDFVNSITGIGNVCERAAMAASTNGRLVQKKVASEGVTVALVMEEFTVAFEGV